MDIVDNYMYENIPYFCEFRQFIDTPVCSKRATHLVESISGEIEERGKFKVSYYYCTEHGIDETCYGFAVAFSLETDKVEGIYVFPEDN